MSSLFGDAQLSALSLQVVHTNALQKTTSCIEKKSFKWDHMEIKMADYTIFKHLKKLYSTERKGQETDWSKNNLLNN